MSFLHQRFEDAYEGFDDCVIIYAGYRFSKDTIVIVVVRDKVILICIQSHGWERPYCIGVECATLFVNQCCMYNGLNDR